MYNVQPGIAEGLEGSREEGWGLTGQEEHWVGLLGPVIRAAKIFPGNDCPGSCASAVSQELVMFQGAGLIGLLPVHLEHSPEDRPVRCIQREDWLHAETP